MGSAFFVNKSEKWLSDSVFLEKMELWKDIRLQMGVGKTSEQVKRISTPADYMMNYV